MDKTQVLQRIKSIGVVPVIRTDTKDDALAVCEAVVAGGINCLEITMTVPGATELITELNKKYGDNVLVGAGTVLDTPTAEACISAGAKFVVTPCLVVDVIELCNRRGVLVCAGALTPTEIVTAWQTGADVVKVFPVSAVGGPRYLKAIKGPFPEIELMPTGGITLETARDFIRAEACAVGVGGDLTDVSALRNGDTARIERLASQYLKAVRD